MSIGQILASGDASGRGRRASRAAFGLVLLAAVFAAVPAQARAHRSHHRAAGRVAISGVNCTPTYTTVTCTFATSRAVVASVGTGTSKKVLVTTSEGRRHASHAVTVRGLEPGFEYFARIQAAAPGGKPASVWTSFSTLGPGDGPAPTVTIQGRYWLLNGSRFLPIVDKNSQAFGDIGCLQASQVATELATGARFVLVDPYNPPMSGCGSGQADQIAAMHQALAGRMWWNIIKTPLTPDTSQPPMAEVAGWPATSNLAGLWDALSYSIACRSGSYAYMLVAKAAENHAVVGLRVGLGQGLLPPNPPCPNNPQWLASQFWLSAGTGAGIAYDAAEGIASHRYWYGAFEPSPKLVTAAGKLSGQLAAMAPAMLYGRPLAVQPKLVRVPLWLKKKGGWQVAWRKVPPPVRLFGWRYDGKIYLLAVGEEAGAVYITFRSKDGSVSYSAKWATSWNIHKSGVWHHYTWQPTASLKLAGIKGASVAGLWGSRGLKLKGSTATIQLPAMTSGWYVITPKKK